MNTYLKSWAVGLVLVGTVSTATAAGTITNIQAGGRIGAIEYINFINNELTIAPRFDTSDPIPLLITVSHTDDPGGTYHVSESVKNTSGSTWTGYHIGITDETGRPGNVFSNFSQSSFLGLTFDSSSSNSHDLNFVGHLADHNVSPGTFYINVADPGVGNTATFILTQGAIVPEPETGAMLLAGLALIGFIANRRDRFLTNL